MTLINVCILVFSTPNEEKMPADPVLKNCCKLLGCMVLCSICSHLLVDLGAKTLYACSPVMQCFPSQEFVSNSRGLRAEACQAWFV